MADALQITEEYIPYVIYKNLQKFLQYRNVVSGHMFINKEDFSKRFSHYEYITIEGERDDKYGKRKFFLFLIAPDSKYAINTPNFKKLMNTIPGASLSLNCEIVFISQLPLSNFIRNEILNQKAERPNLYIENYEYPIFEIVIPEHGMVPKHFVMTDAEVEEVCQKHYTQKEKLSRMLHTDAPAVWYGVRPGDVFKILRESESNGKAIGYRYVIKG
jgi:DNA-directed RNA polymerase subunit H